MCLWHLFFSFLYIERKYTYNNMYPDILFRNVYKHTHERYDHLKEAGCCTDRRVLVICYPSAAYSSSHAQFGLALGS